MPRPSAFAAFALAILCLTLPLSASAQDCISGTITSEVSTDVGFEGHWKYTLNISWDLTLLGQNALSHIDVLLDVLAGCPCCDAEGLVTFPTPAGTGPGLLDDEVTPCTVQYVGDGGLLCSGDPTVPQTSPAIKFEQAVGDTCEILSVGSGTFYFYSELLSPADTSSTVPDGLLAKFGSGPTSSCTGTLTGNLPTCACSVPVERSTWGGVKSSIDHRRDQ